MIKASQMSFLLISLQFIANYTVQSIVYCSPGFRQGAN